MVCLCIPHNAYQMLYVVCYQPWHMCIAPCHASLLPLIVCVCVCRYDETGICIAHCHASLLPLMCVCVGMMRLVFVLHTAMLAYYLLMCVCVGMMRLWYLYCTLPC